MNSKQPVIEYPPKYVVVQILPQFTVTVLETALEVTNFLWRHLLEDYAVFKNGKALCLEGGEFNEVVERLEKAGQ